MCVCVLFKLLFIQDSSNIVIPELMLPGGFYYNLQVELDIPGAQGSTTDHLFLVNLPPSGGTCDAYPLEGIFILFQIINYRYLNMI